MQSLTPCSVSQCRVWLCAVLASAESDSVQCKSAQSPTPCGGSQCGVTYFTNIPAKTNLQSAINLWKRQCHQIVDHFICLKILFLPVHIEVKVEFFDKKVLKLSRHCPFKRLFIRTNNLKNLRIWPRIANKKIFCYILIGSWNMNTFLFLFFKQCTYFLWTVFFNNLCIVKLKVPLNWSFFYISHVFQYKWNTIWFFDSAPNNVLEIWQSTNTFWHLQ